MARTMEEKLIAHRQADKRCRDKKRQEHPFKNCFGCGETKPLDEFVYSSGEQRYKSKCKACRHKAYIADKERAVERAKLYYKNNRDDVLDKSQKRRKANLEKELLRSARERAQKKGLDFNLDESDIKIPEECPALGIPLSPGNGKVHKNSPSIDRIDPMKGYIKGNVVIVSHFANTIKSDATVDEIRKVADFYEKIEGV